MPAAGTAPFAPRTTQGAWLLGGAYVLLFLLLDWASYIRPLQGLNITPWNPQPALAIALLLLHRRALALVWTGLLVAELVVRGLPQDWLATLAATAALTLCFAAIARALEVRLGGRYALARTRDLFWFTIVVLLGAGVTALAYVSAYALAGAGPDSSFVEAVARYWIGDAVGSLVVLPALLLLIDPQRRKALGATVRSRGWWLVAALVLLLLALVFAREDRDHFRLFYLLMLPVVWAATRQGLPGAVLASGLTQLGLIVAVQSVAQRDLTVFELQLLMAALSLTGMTLGVAVDERERAAAELKNSLRLAAAGQMAAALAHELSQPLTALASYAQALRLVGRDEAMPAERRLGQLAEIAERMAADGVRAGDVVRRLRDFFRSGSTQLQRLPAAPLVAEAIEPHRRRAHALGVTIESELSGIDDGVLLADPVQMAVVLRNLIANAIDAATTGDAPRRVTVRAGKAPMGTLHLEVLDSGRGVDPARLPTLFEPGPSDKPGGMGVGLSISRAIVEAHGGRLWAEPGPHGHLVLDLPLEAGVFDRGADADGA